jgi:hypothetical protein
MLPLMTVAKTTPPRVAPLGNAIDLLPVEVPAAIVSSVPLRLASVIWDTDYYAAPNSNFDSVFCASRNSDELLTR